MAIAAYRPCFVRGARIRSMPAAEPRQLVDELPGAQSDDASESKSDSLERLAGLESPTYQPRANLQGRK
jgi:hypothetical protein